MHLQEKLKELRQAKTLIMICICVAMCSSTQQLAIARCRYMKAMPKISSFLSTYVLIIYEFRFSAKTFEFNRRLIRPSHVLNKYVLDSAAALVNPTRVSGRLMRLTRSEIGK